MRSEDGGDGMTNFERWRENLDEETFIDVMLINCDGCPIPKEERTCSHHVIFGDDCEDVLREWCRREATE